MTEETRVVLIKPGDVLLIGNVGTVVEDMEQARGMAQAFKAVGVKRVFLFSEDIDISKVPE